MRATTHKTVPPWLIVLAVLIAAPDAVAQSDDVPEYEAETRERERRRRPIDDITGFAESIDSSESTAQVTTVAELLSQSPGVRTQRLGGLDDFATVSVRGSSPNQVLVLLDGVPLNTAQLQHVDVNTVSPDLLERIEVYRSGAPIWLGLSPMGGVVNLVTREVDGTAVVASGSYGSFNTRKATLMAALPLALEPDWDLIIGGTYRGTEGDFAFHDDRGTPLNPDDDGTVSRANNGGNGGDLLVRSTLEPAPNLELSLQETLQIDARGVPGLGQNQSQSARYEHLRSITQLQVTARAWPWSATDSRLRLYADVLRDRFDDPGGDIGVGQRDVRSQGQGLGGQAHLSLFAGPAVEVDGVVDARWERFSTRNVRNPDDSGIDAGRWTVAPALQMALHLLDDRLLISPGARYEHVRSDFDGTLPFGASSLAPGTTRTDRPWAVQIGARYDVLEGPVALALHGTAMRSERVPTFVEMFGDTGAVVGNAALDSESVIGGDLGATLSGEGDVVRGHALFAVFAYRYDDLIQFVQNSQRVARPENIGRASVDGLELALGLDAGSWLSFYAAYTLTDAVDDSEVAGQSGQPLPGRPTHDFFTSLTGRFGGLEAVYELDAESESALDRAGFRVVPERVFHNLALYYSPAPGWTLGLEVDNLTDLRVEDVPLRPAPPGVDLSASQAVADYLGYPLPGRTVFGTVRWEYE